MTSKNRQSKTSPEAARAVVRKVVAKNLLESQKARKAAKATISKRGIRLGRYRLRTTTG